MANLPVRDSAELEMDKRETQFQKPIRFEQVDELSLLWGIDQVRLNERHHKSGFIDSLYK